MGMENEKQILMERIKKQYTAGLKPNGKWGIVLDFLIWLAPVISVIDGIFSHGFTPKEIAISCCVALGIPFIIFGENRKKFWLSRVNSSQTPHELLTTIDKSGKELSTLLAFFFVGIGIIITTYLFFKSEIIKSGIVVAVVVALTTVTVVIKPRQTKDIKRLRQLVDPSNYKSSD